MEVCLWLNPPQSAWPTSFITFLYCEKFGNRICFEGFRPPIDFGLIPIELNCWIRWIGFISWVPCSLCGQRIPQFLLEKMAGIPPIVGTTKHNWMLGMVDGRGGAEPVSSCNDCASICDSISACMSFECSDSTLKCNLNSQRDPTLGPYGDYRFCSKGSYLTGCRPVLRPAVSILICNSSLSDFCGRRLYLSWKQEQTSLSTAAPPVQLVLSVHHVVHCSFLFCIQGYIWCVCCIVFLLFWLQS